LKFSQLGLSFFFDLFALMQEYAPLTTRIVLETSGAVIKDGRAFHLYRYPKQGQPAYGSDVTAVVVVAVSQLIFSRSSRGSRVQHALSASLRALHAEKELMTLLNHLGFSVSYTTSVDDQRAVGKEMIVRNEKQFAAVSHVVIIDNINGVVHHRHSTMANKGGWDFNYTTIIAVKERIPRVRMRVEDVNFSDPLRGSLEAKRSNSTVMRKLLKAILTDKLVTLLPEKFRALHIYVDKLYPLNPYAKEMAQVSDVHTLAVLARNEMKNSEAIVVLDHVQSMSKRSPNRKQIVLGDELTYVRLMRAILSRAGNVGDDGLEKLLPFIGLFHVEMNAGHAIQTDLFDPNSLEPGEYATILALLNNRKVKTDIKKDTNAVFDFLSVLFRAYSKGLAGKFFVNAHAVPASFTSVEDATSWVDTHVGQFIDRYVHGLGQVSRTHHHFERDLNAMYKLDEVYTHTLRTFSWLCAFQLIHVVTRRGLGEAVAPLYATWYPIFRSANHIRYAVAAVDMQVLLLGAAGQDVAEQVKYEQFATLPAYRDQKTRELCNIAARFVARWIALGRTMCKRSWIGSFPLCHLINVCWAGSRVHVECHCTVAATVRRPTRTTSQLSSIT